MTKKEKKIKKFIVGGIYGAVDQAISMLPGPNIVWGFVKSGKEAIDTAAFARTSELLDFFEKNADTVLNDILLKDEQFVTGLGITYEKFIKQRLEEKRELIKKIFLSFSIEEKKENFELERLYNALELISLDAIRFLLLLSVHVVPNQKDVIEQSPYNNNNIDEYWAGTSRLQKEHPISKFLDNYKSMNISLGSNNLPKDTLEILKYEDDHVAELVSLGILRYIPQENIKSATKFGKTEFKFVMDYSFTSFGLRFISYLLEEDKNGK